jgi:broad specificity phosphatase PhoE
VLTLVLTRHGLTTRSNPEQHLGQKIDVPLSAEGRSQATALAARLGPIAFERIVSSPLLRARQTAEAIAEVPSPTPRPAIESDPRLLEMDYGAWEGLTYAQIDARDAARRREWEANPARLACPGGESGNQVAARARAFLLDLLARDIADGDVLTDRERPVLAVGHSTFNRVLLCVALDLPIAEFRVRLIQSQVNLTALQWNQGARPNGAKLLLLNDVAHVRRPPQSPWE